MYNDEWDEPPEDEQMAQAVEMWQAQQDYDAYCAPGVPAAILAEEAAIIDREGWFSVDRVFYPTLRDAAIWRRLLAERRVRNRDRVARWAASHPEEVAAA